MMTTNSSNLDVNTLAARMVTRITNEHNLCGFSNDEIYAVLERVGQLLAPEPALIHVSAPIVVFGDIHGQLTDLIKWLAIIGAPPKNKILFMGDYVDRCKKSFEVVMLLFCYKVIFPQHVYMLRGNHECAKMNRIYGFYEEMQRKRTVRMWREFNMVFNELPLTASISKRILCMHGGISPKAKTWEKLMELKKPRTPRECDEGIAVDLMWSDPTNDCCGGFQFNMNRATSVIFDESVVAQLCQSLDIDFICRAHEVTANGHHWQFGHRLVTLFSAPNYCGAEGNCGSVMKVSADLEVSFVTLKPKLEKANLSLSQLRVLRRQTVAMQVRSPDPTAPKELFKVTEAGKEQAKGAAKVEEKKKEEKAKTTAK